MALHHIAQCTSRLVVSPPPIDADCFGRGDLNIVYVPPVPDRLEQAVGKTENEYVLNCLLAEVVIDAEYLILAEYLEQIRIQLLGAGEVAPKRLLDDNPGPRRLLLIRRDQTCLPKHGRNKWENGRGRREVEDPVALGAPFLVDLLEQFRQLPVVVQIGEIGRLEEQAVRKAVPDLGLKRVAGVLFDRFAHVLAKIFVSLFGAGETDDREAMRQ